MNHRHKLTDAKAVECAKGSGLGGLGGQSPPEANTFLLMNA